MAACNRCSKVGPRGGNWGADAPWLAHLVTTFVWSVLRWAWTFPMLVLGPNSLLEWAIACFFGIEFALCFLDRAFWYAFVYFLFDSECVSYKTCLVKAYVSKVFLFLLFWT
jgi:hypothetical protein